MSKSNAQRVQDLEEAKKKYRRSKKLLSLDDLAILYGLTKPAFVNLRKTMEGFPDPAERRGNAFFYPAFAAVSAMHAYVKRHEQQHLDRGRRFSDLVQTGNGEDHHGLTLSAQEQLRAYELRDKLTKEALAQGLMHLASDCAETAEKVLSMISRTFGSPCESMDPNGKWPAEVRAAVDDAGRALVLRCYDEMRDMLIPHVDQPTSRPSRSRADRAGTKPPRKTGKARGLVGKKPR